MVPSIFVITGPPGAGKTSVASALMGAAPHGLHIPVDDLRLWVAGGLADSVPWTDETERQFQLAERAACAVTRSYHKAGYSIAIDHCRNLPRLDRMIGEGLFGLPVRRVLILPALEVCLARNTARTNKTFDPEVLVDTINETHARYRESNQEGWEVFSDAESSSDDIAARLLSALAKTDAPSLIADD